MTVLQHSPERIFDILDWLGHTPGAPVASNIDKGASRVLRRMRRKTTPVFNSLEGVKEERSMFSRGNEKPRRPVGRRSSNGWEFREEVEPGAPLYMGLREFFVAIEGVDPAGNTPEIAELFAGIHDFRVNIDPITGEPIGIDEPPTISIAGDLESLEHIIAIIGWYASETLVPYVGGWWGTSGKFGFAGVITRRTAKSPSSPPSQVDMLHRTIIQGRPRGTLSRSDQGTPDFQVNALHQALIDTYEELILMSNSCPNPISMEPDWTGGYPVVCLRLNMGLSDHGEE